MPIIAVVGSKGSGKTSTVEVLVRELTKKGYKVATVKHIPEENFTIDTEGKDTWRHAKAGAKMIISVAPREIAVIHKVETAKLSLENILQFCEEDIDIVILEGFRNLVGADPKIFKIVTIKSPSEAVDASKNFKNIIAFSGAAASELNKEEIGIPVIDALNEPERLVELVEEKIKEIGKISGEDFTLYVDGNKVSLNPFVRKLMKSVIIAMTSNLKGVDVSRNDRVVVKIKKWGCS
ncbi:molybdopterin-guanine dinucleotide biosynthesis protein B [Candidatus Bathyarchaeota archaeon]|nr:MAG: molybdopterin-guanine dinucleotide biosynthesis protein B [Candidatus Bathyarchaeota archaeon]